MIELLRGYCLEFGLELSELQLRQFNRYYELLLEWNEKINLTAITAPNEVALKHFVDSLSVAQLLPFSNTSTVPKKNISAFSFQLSALNYSSLSLIDVGTGAGFPGIPLKILFPSLKLTLLDSLNKRLKFLQAVVTELALSDVALVHGRAEEIGRSSNHRECYDVATARAVARLNVLCELCLPFVKKQGLFIAQKGAAAADELLEAGRAIALLGGELAQNISVKLPGLDDSRALIAIRKIKPTPSAYPRQAGTPERKPL
ncbi:MAG: 16S rRNA (guanine(527)-N(7))-methyltransferase RsmG [Bacillota bacterium]